MSYTPHIRVRYEIATQGQIADGRTIDILDRPGGQAAILLAPGHSSEPLAAEITRLSYHQIVHGMWRQRWTDDGRMRRPAQGLQVAVSRWETVPAHMMPSGRIVFGVEQDGSCVWLIDEDYCTRQLQNGMNDLLLRLAGDGLWIQMWLRRRPLQAAAASPLLAPPTQPLLTV